MPQENAHDLHSAKGTQPGALSKDSTSVRQDTVQAQWFALYTSSRHEKRVAEYLKQRDTEVFLPLYRSVRRWRNRRTVDLELPVFPGYLFVRITPPQRRLVIAVPGVIRMAGSAQKPVPMPEQEIESLRAGLHLRRVEPHPYLTVGKRYRISAGALTGMEGVLVRQKNGFRVVLTLDLLMQSVAVEVDVSELEPVRPGSCFPTVMTARTPALYGAGRSSIPASQIAL